MAGKMTRDELVAQIEERIGLKLRSRVERGES